MEKNLPKTLTKGLTHPRQDSKVTMHPAGAKMKGMTRCLSRQP